MAQVSEGGSDRAEAPLATTTLQNHQTASRSIRRGRRVRQVPASEPGPSSARWSDQEIEGLVHEMVSQVTPDKIILAERGWLTWLDEVGSRWSNRPA
jgi:hypothetical protein